MSITVNGKVDQGKAQVEGISVTHGATKKYKSVDDVPPELREQVNNLIRKSSGAPAVLEKEDRLSLKSIRGLRFA